MEIEPLLLRISEVVKMLNLSRSKVYDLIARGELPSIRIGRSCRVPRTALHAWLASQVSTPE